MDVKINIIYIKEAVPAQPSAVLMFNRGDVLMGENDILEKIRTYMKLQNWTLYRLAKESEIPYTSLHSMFEKNTQPTLPTLRKICSGLGISLSDFFADDLHPVSPNKYTEDELELLEMYRHLSAKDKKLVLTLCRRLPPLCRDGKDDKNI